ncbi:Fic family protein [[Clostridium] symbiosum]|nr:Fic family protein [[Clostridium] symbiosum]MCB6610991.1 Fic family protein [[Clostridium] symbiosum]MCB6931545.1 Fic family protein [[Clostridium] symbiosum]
MKAANRWSAAAEKIHPFQDGNGRTGRMILFRECLKNGIIPFLICDENKDQYTHLLNAAQKTGSFAALAGYFKEEACKYYDILQEFLKVYES